MIDHISLRVSDFKRSKPFYDAALAPLGGAMLMGVGVPGVEGGGYGRAGRPIFWIGSAPGAAASGPTHVAFMADTRAAVDAFYAAAMGAGGKDNGGPGLRPEYHPDYYGAFVLDPDGNNIEAVCHAPG